MPRHPFKKFQAGERLPGLPKEILNAVVSDRRGENALSNTRVKGLVPDSGIVLVKNNSGAARSQFAILGINAPIIGPTPVASLPEFKKRVTFSCITPTTAAHSGKFVVLLEPLLNGAIGKAVVSGVVQVRLTGADVGWATVTNNDATKLTASATGSAEVLWAEAGSSERWAIVVLHSRNDTTGSAATFSGAAASRSTGQTINNDSTWYAVEFNTELYDTDDFWALSPNPSRLTIPATGYYLIVCNGALQMTGTGWSHVALWTNGALNAIGTNVQTVATFSSAIYSMSYIYKASGTGTYFETKVRNDGSASISTSSGCQMSISKIGDV